MARKRHRSGRRRKPRSPAKWTRVSKVPLGKQFLYTFVCRYGTNKIQAVQIVHGNDSGALRLAKRQFEAYEFEYAYGYGEYAYAYGGYVYAYGYGYGYGYGYAAYAY